MSECLLHEADFTESDLSEGMFERCDFSRAVFHHSKLEKADFRTSYGYIIDLEHNQVKNAKFSYPSVLGLLTKYRIIVE